RPLRAEATHGPSRPAARRRPVAQAIGNAATPRGGPHPPADPDRTLVVAAKVGVPADVAAELGDGGVAVRQREPVADLRRREIGVAVEPCAELVAGLGDTLRVAGDRLTNDGEVLPVEG